MKILLIGICLFTCGVLCGQERSFEFVFSKKIGNDSKDIQYARGIFSGSSPSAITFLDGRLLWVAQGRGAQVLDTKVSGKFVRTIQYPDYRLGAEYGDRTDYIFSNGVSVADSGLFTVFSDDMTQIVSSVDLLGKMDFVDARPILLGDRGFYLKTDKSIVSVTKDGGVHNSQDTLGYLLKQVELDWYPDEQTRAVHRVQIQNETNIVNEGLVYPFLVQNLSDYFLQMGLRSSPILEPISGEISTGPILGMSLVGEVIFESTGEELRVFTQSGKEYDVSSVAVEPWMNGNKDKNFIGPLYAVHPNGDIWAAYAIKDDKVYFYKASKTWGTDYVALAKNGIKSDEVAKTRDLIQSFNNPELRIVRYAFFALQGFDFQSWDLKSYFNGYDWYKPNPAVKSDPSTLNENQKRLFDLIVAEEARRK